MHRDCTRHSSPLQKDHIQALKKQFKKVIPCFFFVFFFNLCFKAPLFKGTTHNYIPVASPFEIDSLPLLCFQGAEAEIKHPDSFTGPQVTSLLDTSTGQPCLTRGEHRSSLFNYTSQSGSVTRGSQKNILQACSQQNRRALPTQH